MFLPSTRWYIFILVGYVSSSPAKLIWNGTKVSYAGAQVWRSPLRNGKDIAVFNALIDEQAISPWAMKAAYVDYLVLPSQIETVGRHLRVDHGISYKVLIEDVEQKLKKRLNQPNGTSRNKIRSGHRMHFADFQTLPVIYEYLDYINLNNQICTVTTIGRSVENRPIQMAVVSNNKAGNKAILIIGGTHGREWAAVSSVLFTLNELVTKFDNQPDHVQNKNWYIIPVLNPDGYDYTQKIDRFWRKNRRKFDNDENCEGVDLNRNFGHNWYIGQFVGYQSPCKITYRGKYPLSEPETVAVMASSKETIILTLIKRPSTNKTFIEDLSRIINLNSRYLESNLIEGRRFTALVDIHSYGQEVVYPWASVSEPTPHEEILHSISEEMTMEAYNKYGSRYKYGPLYHIQYPATGSSMDYAYASGIHYTFTIEARDTGQNGFILPPEQIVSAAVEVQATLHSLARSLETEHK